MQFTQDTILGFFDSSQKSYEIPVYQRAYSWDKKNWTIFLEDLFEQLNSENNYFYGNILLETIKKNKKYEIIDGQQRITTLTIFMRALINTLNKRKEDELLIDFEFEEKIKIYLKNNGNIKLRPVQYDQACYDSVIIDDNSSFETSTPSQERMLEAKQFFEKELSELSTEKVLLLLEKIEDTDLTIIELNSKKDSALMFELENNRGKDLTNMEKLKSYFMYQMYICSKEEETETNIENIANIFKSIYLIINDLKLDEDSILIYHNQAYINQFHYRTLKNVKDEFKKSNNKIDWIKDYIAELKTTFSNIKKFEQIELDYAKYLNSLGIIVFAYPFIIKGYKFFGDDNAKLNELFRILEVLTFRAKLINSRAKIEEKLNKVLIEFEGDTGELRDNIKNKLNDAWYWKDDRVEYYLNGYMYENKVLKHLLWRYENNLQNNGYSSNNLKIKNEQIEHISPQKPTNGSPIETGYDVDENNEYSEEFIKECLNCIGNLMLISGSHNSSIGNKPFKDKIKTYNNNPLLNQQAEIKEFAVKENDEHIWKKESINKRHEKILNFALKTWSFDW